MRKNIGRKSRKLRKENARLSGHSGINDFVRAGLFTNTRKDVEYFTKTVNQTQDDGHHDRYHDYGEYQTFNNSNMVNSRYSHETILTAKHRKALPFCAVSFAVAFVFRHNKTLPGHCYCRPKSFSPLSSNKIIRRPAPHFATKTHCAFRFH